MRGILTIDENNLAYGKGFVLRAKNKASTIIISIISTLLSNLNCLSCQNNFWLACLFMDNLNTCDHLMSEA